MDGGSALFFLGLLGIGIFFPGYPLLLCIIQALTTRGPTPLSRHDFRPTRLPKISILIAARNAEAFVKAKIANCLALDYPGHLLEVLFFSDGSSDGTVKKALSFSQDPRVRILESPDHVGKIEALNRMVPQARGEIVVFTDVDALLNRRCLLQFLGVF